jgi:hypothetical protein
MQDVSRRIRISILGIPDDVDVEDVGKDGGDNGERVGR